MTYYFFNVDPLYKKICSNYELFSFFKKIYLNNKDSNITELQYKNITKRINQSKINKDINNLFKSNKFYEQKNLYHYYNNKYRDEYYSLKICNNMLIYNANHLNNKLFDILNNYKLFVCNFDEQLFFWINDMSY